MRKLQVTDPAIGWGLSLLDLVCNGISREKYGWIFDPTGPQVTNVVANKRSVSGACDIPNNASESSECLKMQVKKCIAFVWIALWVELTKTLVGQHATVVMSGK